MLSDSYIKQLEGCIYNTPLALLSIKDQESLEYIQTLLPFSTGFEIDVNAKDGVTSNIFKEIPYIIKCDVSTGSEQRFRIPMGINGIICLYLISSQLKNNHELNIVDGSIHYHIDWTDMKDVKVTNEWLQGNSEWILNELDSWNYKGSYNGRSVYMHKGGWLGYRTNTFEFRCGNVTFDYEILVKQIIHANDIIRRLKEQLGYRFRYTNLEFDPKLIIDYIKKYPISGGSNVIDKEKINELKQQLKKKNEETPRPLKQEEIKNITKSRVVKI